MQIMGKSVQCFVAERIPRDDEVISDDLRIDELMKITNSISYYFRDPNDCPFGRGNWILDLHLNDGQTWCFKYPIEMTIEHFLNYLKPLLDRFKEKMN